MLNRTLNLALQGGGSHGAFTWGVLDALLEDGRISLEGLSGTSAGAVNAVALASGWGRALLAGHDPRQGARESLERLWQQIAAWGSLGAWQRKLADLLWGGLPAELAPPHLMAQTLRSLVSPYQANPLDINPLRDLLEQQIDFEAVRHSGLKVFVSATHVNTGKATIFTAERLDARAVMASACLPMLFQAVEIDGQPYWDGGYSVNPALSPLIHACDSADLMLVQINPLRRDRNPRTPGEILDRVNELTFNASLLTQMRAIEYVNRMVAEGAVAETDCKVIRVHRIDGGAAMQDYPISSRTSTDANMIAELFALGRSSAQQWLQQHFQAVGRASTVDIVRDYLDDTRFELPGRRGTALAEPRRIRRWFARLLPFRRG
jgi:NTE family protein